MKHPQSSIFRQLLIDADFLNESSDSEWPSFISSMPDGETVVSNCAALYDTPGLGDGRLMSTGENIIHFGVMIHVRSDDYMLGWDKLNDICQYAETVKNCLVIVESSSYNVVNIRQSSNQYSLGQEKTTKRREIFGCNFLLTVKEAIE